jgi:hypothetical protein
LTLFPPTFLSNYTTFCSELQVNFGPLDPVGTAESELETLRMRENQHISKYIVAFNRHATQVSWGSEALRHVFYRGLPDRIKDQISQVGKPATLVRMKELAQTIDARYWERKAESARDSNRFTPAPSTPRVSTANSATPSFASRNTPAKSAPTPTPAQHSATQTPRRPHLADKLGQDGKLTPAERKRRMDNKLCMFCGGVGHMAKECRRASSSAAKARAATLVDPAPSDASSSEK